MLDKFLWEDTFSGVLGHCSENARDVMLENYRSLAYIRLSLGKNPCECNGSEKAFSYLYPSTNRYQLNLERNSMNRNYTSEKCNQCKECCYPSPLKIYAQSNAGKKPYKCFQYGKASSFRTHLGTHTVEKLSSSSCHTPEGTHTWEKLYECCDCRKAFTRSSDQTGEKLSER
ncbi:hypothetical protein QTO34_015560 [Cnephaeus nilssonii]|uniref:Uncharacterized protein n=1 Tax=Cnephaeus nilssonii TaxID=3371016 RepID=A0AA40LSY7_CNENI|nr:hypothetical protein QTO34_015560 [Eptesicus nilssonii]